MLQRASSAKSCLKDDVKVGEQPKAKQLLSFSLSPFTRNHLQPTNNTVQIYPVSTPVSYHKPTALHSPRANTRALSQSGPLRPRLSRLLLFTPHQLGRNPQQGPLPRPSGSHHRFSSSRSRFQQPRSSLRERVRQLWCTARDHGLGRTRRGDQYEDEGGCFGRCGADFDAE